MSQLKRYRCFLAVAEELHFRRAAEKLNITQPALSQNIAELEKELGAKLFDRDRRSVSVTREGEILKPAAQAAIKTLDTAFLEIGRHSAAESKRLAIGFVEYLNLPFLPATLAELNKSAPDITVEKKEMSSDAVIQALVRKEIDIGVAFLPLKHGDLAYRSVLTGNWMVAMRANHPLAEQAKVSLELLDGEQLILFARELNPPLFEKMRRKFAKSAPGADIAHQVSQSIAGPKYVADGLGLFIYASYVLDQLPDGVVSRPIAGFSPIELGLVWRGDRRTKAVRALLDAHKTVSSKKNEG